MAFLSIFIGYYTVNVFKNMGEQYHKLNDDRYLTLVGSIAAVFNSIRFIWSGMLDKYSYKKVYGTMLSIQIIVASTMYLAVRNKYLYGAWVLSLIHI